MTEEDEYLVGRLRQLAKDETLGNALLRIDFTRAARRIEDLSSSYELARDELKYRE